MSNFVLEIKPSQELIDLVHALLGVKATPQEIVPPMPAAQPVQSVQPTVPVTAPPVVGITTSVPIAEAKTYTLNELALAASQLIDKGSRDLLTKYGIGGMTELPVEQYGAFAADLRALGAKL